MRRQTERRPVASLVSVVMPALDEEAFIAEALESVCAQSYRPIEVIVVDDGSTDRTAEIAAAYPVRLLRHTEPRGAAAAQNTGLGIARGGYFTIFDADDVMAPRRLEFQVAHLAEHPQHGLVLGLTEAFVSPGEPRPPNYNPGWDDGPFPACAGTMLARRTLLDVVGPFDDRLRLSYDVDWLARAKDAGVRAGRIDRVCLRYRIHRGNSSADARAVHGAMLGLLRASVRRRHQGVAHG